MYSASDPGTHNPSRIFTCAKCTCAQYKEILKMMEDNFNIDVVYLDFAKVFDKCDPGILLRKLKWIGITGKIGTWILEFLS